jgi:hypothetical protein
LPKIGLADQRDATFDRDFEQWPGIPVMLEYDFNRCIDNVAKLKHIKKYFLYPKYYPVVWERLPNWRGD